MGGGTATCASIARREAGLSPRGRGNLGRRAGELDYTGSIPAWAGEPVPGRVGSFSPPVYPRVGGGTCTEWTVRPPRAGLSRVGGGTASAKRSMAGMTGLSPRGRGNRVGRYQGYLPGRSIPAWAGNRDQVTLTVAMYGSIPAWAGNRDQVTLTVAMYGSIPAWAGEPGSGHADCRRCTGLSPRGRGTATADAAAPDADGLSPRGRGTLTLVL